MLLYFRATKVHHRWNTVVATAAKSMYLAFVQVTPCNDIYIYIHMCVCVFMINKILKHGYTNIYIYMHTYNHQPKMQRQVPSPRHIQDTINKMYHL